jgi:DNA-binding transcriptional MerR regulator
MSPTTGEGDAHLSIGEVLAELRDEFPDITISKIRFLESQGLVNPERTPSGYRKFYAADLVRLRWILHQQKEHFLPLKVIKERLDALPPGGEAALLDPGPAAPLDDALDAAPEPSPEPSAEPSPEPSAEPSAEPSPEVAPAASATTPAGRAPSATTRATTGSGPATPEPTSTRSRRPPGRPRPPAFAPDLPAETAADDGAVLNRAGGGYSRAELASAAGLTGDQLAELESFGLLTPSRESGGEAEFDEDALEVARIGAGFFSRGIEARHLRMYRNVAEREALLFGQVLMPFVRQRNPEARARMQEELVELAALGRRLRLVLLREAVRDSLAE